jgi:phosphoglycolate phosphatase
LPGFSFMARRLFDLIVFDWDGTLSDSTALIVNSLQAAVVDAGGKKPSTASALYVIGMGLRQALEYLAPDIAPEKHLEMAASYRHHYALGQHDIHLFPGVLEMLHELKHQHYWLAIATDETQSKPHPLMLEELIRAFAVSPERTLMIGDTTHDLEMAHHAGCASIGVSYGAHEPAAFPQWNPKAVLHTPLELHQWLVDFA